MVDKSGKYWYGSEAGDVDTFLREYAEDAHLDCRAVRCGNCGGEALKMRMDRVEGAIQVVCMDCGTKKILLDCGEIWEDANPRLRKCAACKTGVLHNVRVGFSRRADGNAQWVYIGSRCIGCGVLASYLDWEIDYAPTGEMENNL